MSKTTLSIPAPPKKGPLPDQKESIYKRLQSLQIFEVDPKPRIQPIVNIDKNLFITPQKSQENMKSKAKEITKPVLMYTTSRLDTVPLAVIQQDLEACGRLVPPQKSVWKRISANLKF
jgi:hypothetical protein